MVVKSAMQSGVMYAAGSPISYTSCSVTPATLTRPPVPRCLVISNVPAGQRPLQAAQQIVSRHDADAQLASEPEPARDIGDGLRAGPRVHATGVGGDLDAPLGDDREDALHRRHEVLGVPERRVARFLLLQDGHGHFGQVVHHQVVDGPARHLAVRRLEPIAPKPLAGGDPHGARVPRRRHGSGSRRTASEPIPSDAWMRTSMSGANPSGRMSSGGRARGTTARPPATTRTSVPPPEDRGWASRKRTRTVACQGWAPL